MGLTVTDMGCKKNIAAGGELKKHAATIHCSNTLSLLQRKISNALLYHAYSELLLKEEHEISVKELCRLISYQGNNHSVIKEALKELLSTVIEWNVVSDTTGVEDWTASSILASVSLRGPLCLYAYSPRMKQLLHSPSMFGKINLFIQSRFKSGYGLALYENCIRYRGLAFTKWFEVEIFRKLMGVPSGKYSVFRDFKRRVLDKSVEEVNTYSDLIVEPEIYREGRLVRKIRFTLKERAKKTRLGTTPTLLISETVSEDVSNHNPELAIKTKLMEHYGLLPHQCKQLFAEYAVEFIQEKMDIIESSSNYVRGKVQNPAAYLISALKHNYQQSKPAPSKTSEKNRRDMDHKACQRVVDKIKKEYTTYRDQQIDTVIEKLSAYKKRKFFARFCENAESAINTILKLQRKKYTKETILHSPQIKAMQRQFAIQDLSLQNVIISIEQFVDTLSEPRQKAWKNSQSEYHIE